MQPETWFAMQFPPVRSISTPKLLRKSERRYYKITGSDDPESRQAFTDL